ncbi:glutathione peroxidase [Aestuariirhabdus sp. Z084]|uniref:glutathione peroxidase n=1 Tax=Aestuariirhabdus haliotis TaxID=2918751 RepID=UPI00201B3DD6|nr:glutathione peroxidase [Aestuariirhabdus haliotis]MCL6417105.1 glutathione peroxidase [Aestuariirhabdus haliotis]MCL6420605.1 glutathione peroxidase [Aestuariirhabdus haliotis]
MQSNREGQKIPQATFNIREDNEWKQLSTDQLFRGKNVILFALPGAFTPTCSSTHLPRYNELAEVFAANGIDEILCLSVNDTFVMNEWQAIQHAENIRFIPDGNGEFSEGMGMLVNKNELGFGQRSWRYSMLVRDGVIEKMFIEPDQPGDPFEVSDADTMLEYLNPNAQAPEFVTLFTKPGCPHCARAKALLEDKGYRYEQIELGGQITTRSLRAATGAGTVPQIFIGGKLIGSADELEAHLA